jgi:hypothetical protein
MLQPFLSRFGQTAQIPISPPLKSGGIVGKSNIKASHLPQMVLHYFKFCELQRHRLTRDNSNVKKVIQVPVVIKLEIEVQRHTQLLRIVKKR